MSKKQVKIQIFERLKNEKISQDPDFMVNWIVKPSNIEELDPIGRLFFFYCKIFVKNKFFFVCTAGLPISEKKKIVPVEKNFFSPPPNIEEYVLPTNQSDRCLEDT